MEFNLFVQRYFTTRSDRTRSWRTQHHFLKTQSLEVNLLSLWCAAHAAKNDVKSFHKVFTENFDSLPVAASSLGVCQHPQTEQLSQKTGFKPWADAGSCIFKLKKLPRRSAHCTEAPVKLVCCYEPSARATIGQVIAELNALW